jgi:DNA-binding IclR family transcriptional regulator
MSQSATKRCLQILEFLATHSEGSGLAEICAELRIPKSVAHRLLALLVEHGFVRQDNDSSRYALTLKLTFLGLRYYVGIGLSDVSQPILDRLAAETGELVRLAVVDGETLVWTAKAQGARYGLKYDPDTGLQVVLHATATGKAWLSTLPEEDALKIVAATNFVTPSRFGPDVIRDIDRFREELRGTRKRGYGIAIEEGEPGTAAVAVPVRAEPRADAPAVATLSIAGPVTRFPAERREALGDLLAGAASELSELWPIRTALGAGMVSAETSVPENVNGVLLDHAS